MNTKTESCLFSDLGVFQRVRKGCINHVVVYELVFSLGSAYLSEREFKNILDSLKEGDGLVSLNKRKLPIMACSNKKGVTKCN